MPPLRRSLDGYVPLAFGLLLALPTLLAYYPPATDLPYHEGMVGLLRHYGDAGVYPPGVYRINLGHPNQLFHGAAAVLSFVVSTRWAVKLVIAAAQVLLLTGVGRTATHFRRSPWLALLAAPIGLGWFYYWGLMTSLVGFAVFFHAVPSLDRHSHGAGHRAWAVPLAWFVLAYFAHETAMFLSVAAYALFAVVHAPSLRALARASVPAWGMALLAVVHVKLSSKLFPEGAVIAAADFPAIGHRLRLFADSIFGSHEPVASHGLLATLAGVLALVTRDGLRQRRPWTRASTEIGSLVRLQALARAHRVSVLGVACFTAYFALPFNWNGGTFLYERCLMPGLLFLGLGLAPRGARALHALTRAMLAALVVAVLLVGAPQFAEATRLHRSLDRLLAPVTRGSSVALVRWDRGYDPMERCFSTGAAVARTAATVGGRAMYDLTISPIAPVIMHQDRRWARFDARVHSDTRQIRPAVDLHRYRYLVVQSRDPSTHMILRVLLRPWARYVAHDGEWMLLESTIEPWSLAEGEGPVTAEERGAKSVVEIFEASVPGGRADDQPAPASPAGGAR